MLHNVSVIDPCRLIETRVGLAKHLPTFALTVEPKSLHIALWQRHKFDLKLSPQYVALSIR